MKSRVIVSAIIEKGGKFLLGRKPADVAPYPNTWHLIGGGVNLEDESLEEGMRREIREEVGIDVANFRHVSFDEDQTLNKQGEETHYLFLVYHVDYKSGDVVPSDDIAQAHWFSKDELKTLSLTPPSQKLFTKLGWI